MRNQLKFMKLSLDFGGSTLDGVVWGNGGVIEGVFTKEVVDVESKDLSKVLDGIVLPWDRIDQIFVTGGKSKGFDNFYRDIEFKKIPEIEAIACGGRFLFEGQKPFLVVSMGTGTCMVKIDENGFEHVGGTGVGGGTFLGLAKGLLGESDVEVLKEMFKEGDSKKVDLSVGDIVGGGIGIVGASATASNLGRMSREIEFSASDLASGIANLIGQSIGSTVCFAAKAVGCQQVLLTGKLTLVEQILNVILKVGKFYGVDMMTVDKGAYVAAIGAGVYSLGNEKESE